MWIQCSEPELELSDKNSTTSLRGNKQSRLSSPTNLEDRPEIRDSFKSSLKQGASNVAVASQQSTTSYNEQFDWKRWYSEKVDSDDDLK